VKTSPPSSAEVIILLHSSAITFCYLLLSPASLFTTSQVLLEMLFSICLSHVSLLLLLYQSNIIPLYHHTVIHASRCVQSIYTCVLGLYFVIIPITHLYSAIWFVKPCWVMAARTSGFSDTVMLHGLNDSFTQLNIIRQRVLNKGAQTGTSEKNQQMKKLSHWC